VISAFFLFIILAARGPDGDRDASLCSNRALGYVFSGYLT
jgi:hypothetical protein